MKVTRALGSTLAALTLGLSALTNPHPVQADAQVNETLSPGFTYHQSTCTINKSGTQNSAQGTTQDSTKTIEFEELRLQPKRGLELRALKNSQAIRNPRCRGNYGGPDLEALVREQQTSPEFEILGATNGTFFRVTDQNHYTSNHLLWTRGDGKIAPLRKTGGKRVFVADREGGHEIKIGFTACGKAACVQAFGKTLKPDAFLDALARAYPSMTLALQSHMPLRGDTNYLRCHSDRPDWRCQTQPRTALCARKDGSISLFTTSAARLEDLTQCQSTCVIFYNLDGGGSTQMGYRSPKNETPRWKMSGNPMETAEPGCSSYRPVDHYLAIGKPR